MLINGSFDPRNDLVKLPPEFQAFLKCGLFTVEDMQKNPEEVVRQVTDRLSYLGATS